VRGQCIRDRADPGDGRVARLRRRRHRPHRDREQPAGRQRGRRDRPGHDLVGRAGAAHRLRGAPDRHRRDQLHDRRPLAAVPRNLAGGCDHARRRGAVRRSQGRRYRRNAAGRLPVQRRHDQGLVGPVRRGRRAHGNRSRLDRRAAAVGPRARHGVPAHVHPSRHLDRRRTERARRAQRHVQRGVPGPSAPGRQPVRARSAPTCSGSATARLGTSCDRNSATWSTIATARPSAASRGACS
jgi:hypothetical protein